MLESLQLRAPDNTSGAFVVPAGGLSRLATESSMLVDGRPLAELLATFPGAQVRGDRGVSVLDVTYRSSEVRSGSLFFCVPGSRTDGHLFAAGASVAGAVAVVVEHWLEVPGVQVLVSSVRGAMGPMSAAFFAYPSTHM